MKRIILSALLVLMTAVLTVQCATGNASEKSYNTEGASRDIAERNLVIKKSFTEVDVSSGIQLHYTVGTSNKVRVVGAEELVENTVVTVEGSVLKMYINRDYLSRSRKTNNLIVYVTAPAFNDIKVHTGSCVTMETEMSVAGDFSAHGSSGAIFKANKGLMCKKLHVTLSSGAIAELHDIKATAAFLAASSGAILTAEGAVTTLEANISSGAIANLTGLQARKGSVKASSGAIAKICKGDFEVSSSSGAIIHRK